MGEGEAVTIRWEQRAVRELRGLPDDAQRRVVTAVEQLQENPLKGAQLSGRWKGLRRLRVGSYRVVYAFDGAKILVSVVRVAHRREAYRG